MDKLLKISQELISVADDISRRIGRQSSRDDDLYDFDQIWASTALGFGGMGGSAMTIARTYVFIPHDVNTAYVYFAGMFAYKCGINDKFWKDFRNHNMRSVAESGVYNR